MRGNAAKESLAFKTKDRGVALSLFPFFLCLWSLVLSLAPPRRICLWSLVLSLAPPGRNDDP
jgi:hypothetical protein